MDSRIIAALIIGAIVGLIGAMIIACLIIDSEEDEAAEEIWREFNEVHNSGRTEGQAAPEIQQKNGDDVHPERDGRV